MTILLNNFFATLTALQLVVFGFISGFIFAIACIHRMLWIK